jgi:hypothetical protein
MTLSDYLKQPDTNATRFAAECKVAVSTITRAARGEISASPALMMTIFEKSGGAVTPNDFMGIAA